MSPLTIPLIVCSQDSLLSPNLDSTVPTAVIWRDGNEHVDDL